MFEIEMKTERNLELWDGVVMIQYCLYSYLAQNIIVVLVHMSSSTLIAQVVLLDQKDSETIYPGLIPNSSLSPPDRPRSCLT